MFMKAADWMGDGELERNEEANGVCPSSSNTGKVYLNNYLSEIVQVVTLPT